MSDLSDLEIERAALPIKAQREAAGLERAITEVEQVDLENEAHRQFLVRAPKAGIVTAMTADPGQLISSNLPLASIVPAEGELEAELYAPSRTIGFVKNGSNVLLRYQAFPYQKFGQQRGVVHEISRTPLQPHEIGSPLARDLKSSEPLYRIRVKLDRQSILAYGQAEALKSGMQLEAGLVLEHRKLAEWVLDPIYSMTGRL